MSEKLLMASLAISCGLATNCWAFARIVCAISAADRPAPSMDSRTFNRAFRAALTALRRPRRIARMVDHVARPTISAPSATAGTHVIRDPYIWLDDEVSPSRPQPRRFIVDPVRARSDSFSTRDTVFWLSYI